MPHLAWFDAAESTRLDLVGGKAANLGAVSQAGFNVPAGFAITTEAYADFLQSGPSERIAELVGAKIDTSDTTALEELSRRVRELVESSAMPATVADAIGEAYARLEPATRVAVRSSATTEDLAGASFAGLHDTILGVQGVDAVLDAVRKCWSSLWTGRAIAYRRERGFADNEALMGVVVQTMVDSESSGVMFTGNPVTEANDEIVINSSWGLGEAIVSSAVNPDQFTVSATNLRIVDRQLADKTVQVVPNEDHTGTIHTEVPAARRREPSLTDDHLKALARLGLAVQEHYDGIPQDIEWAMCGGELFLLQSRPITGVNFAWDHEVDYFHKEEEDPDAIWSRVLADDVWTGAITPLMYSHRGEAWVIDYRDGANPILQDPELASVRVMKYHKGEAYVNVAVERGFMRAAPPFSRPGMAVRLPAELQAEAIAQPFSYWDYAKSLIRAKLVYPSVGTPYGWMRFIDDCVANRIPEAAGPPPEELRELSDDALKRQIRRLTDFEHEYNKALIWPGLFIYVRELMVSLSLMLMKWYDGEHDPMAAFTQLITGTENITRTVREHLSLYEMSRMIVASERLRSDFAARPGQSFFDTLAASEDGRALQAKIDGFLVESGHRGHSDRDIYFPRYNDDPDVLYRALEAHTKSDVDPMIRERENNERRREIIADVETNLRRKPLGALKLEAFRYAFTYVMRFLEYRDDERHFVDRNTYGIRRAYLEVNRRVRERGGLETDRDFWFLSQPELYSVLDGTHNPALIAAKVRGRMRNFEAFDSKEYAPPKFLRGNRPLPSAADAEGDGNLLAGIPTSAGMISGTARVVKELSQIGRVAPGDILIANSTDPGWSPVFAIISGVVVETGGMLSHSSCLAREYGFPAVQVEGAVRLIPDGATITVDGNTGTVTLETEPEPSAEPEPVLA
jgi:rifampicin phosphotransferase